MRLRVGGAFFSSGSNSLGGGGGGRPIGLASTGGDLASADGGLLSGSDIFSFCFGGSGRTLEGGEGRRDSTTGRFGAGGSSLEIERGWGTGACSVAGIDDGRDNEYSELEESGSGQVLGDIVGFIDHYINQSRPPSSITPSQKAPVTSSPRDIFA